MDSKPFYKSKQFWLSTAVVMLGAFWNQISPELHLDPKIALEISGIGSLIVRALTAGGLSLTPTATK